MKRNCLARCVVVMVCAVLLSGLRVLGANGPAVPAWLQQMRDAGVAYESRNYEKASSLVRMALAGLASTNPSDETVLRCLDGLSNLLMEERRYSDAVRVLETSVNRRQSNNVHDINLLGNLVLLGDVYVELRRYDDAERVLSQAVKMGEHCEDPFLEDSLERLGNAYSAHHRDAQATTCYTRAAAIAEALNDRDAPALLKKAGDCDVKLKRYEAGMKSYIKGVELSQKPDVASVLVDCLISIKPFIDNQNDLKALAHKWYERYSERLASTLHDKSDPPTAVQLFALHYLLGSLALLEGNKVKSVPDFERCWELLRTRDRLHAYMAANRLVTAYALNSPRDKARMARLVTDFIDDSNCEIEIPSADELQLRLRLADECSLAGHQNEALRLYLDVLARATNAKPSDPTFCCRLNQTLGDLLLLMGQKIPAQRHFEQSIHLRDKCDPVSVAVVQKLIATKSGLYLRLGDAYMANSDIADAKRAYVEALHAGIQQRTESPEMLCFLRQKIAACDSRLGDLNAIRIFYENELARARTKPLAAARLVDLQIGLSDYKCGFGQLGEARKLLEDALRASSGESEETKNTRVRVLRRLSQLTCTIGDINEAKKFADQSVALATDQHRKIEKDQLASAMVERALSWITSASALARGGQLETARRHLANAMSSVREIPEDAPLGVLNSLSSVYAYCSDPKRAEQATKRSVQFVVENQNKPFIIAPEDQRRALGNFYAGRGQTPEAERIALDTLDVYRKKYGEAEFHFTGALFDLACLYAGDGVYDRAESCLKQCLSLRLKTFGASDFRVVQTELILARLICLNKDRRTPLRLKNALAFTQSALDALKRQPSGTSYPVLQSEAILTQARINVLQGRKQEALQLIQQALSSVQRIGGPRDLLLGQALFDAANTCYCARLYEHAFSYASRSVEIRRGSLGPDVLQLAASHDLLSRVCQAQGKSVAAVDNATKAKMYAGTWLVPESFFQKQLARSHQDGPDLMNYGDWNLLWPLRLLRGA